MENKIDRLIKLEAKRQREKIGLIPSENNISPHVAKVLGSCLSNKYSEGYPGARYYEGSQNIDMIELEAQALIRKLFNVPYVNVQPYSGSPANSAIEMALLDPGDKIVGLSLSSGGHLTHGHPKVTFSGRFFNSIQFNCEPDGTFDYDKIAKQVVEAKPKMMIIGTTAYPFTLDFEKFREIADKTDAYLVADISHICGLVISGDHPNPVPYVDVIMSTTHKTFRGPRGAMIMVTDRGLAKDPKLDSKIAKAVFPGLQGGPHNATVAGIAIAAQEAMTESYRQYGHQIVRNAQALARTLAKHDIEMIGGGTENHLIVVTLCPQFGEGYGGVVSKAMDTAGIYANKNTVPFETSSPSRPSGLRLGTPLVTTRGMKEKEMEYIGDKIAQVIEYVKDQYATVYDYQYIMDNIAEDQYLIKMSREVKSFAFKFPMFRE